MVCVHQAGVHTLDESAGISQVGQDEEKGFLKIQDSAKLDNLFLSRSSAWSEDEN